MGIYTLYIKTHNKTGLKYLGQTTQDPYVYLGSGYDWTDHMRSHGEKCGIKLSIETRKKPLAQVSCLICRKVHDVANHTRHHGAKCKALYALFHV